MLGGARRPVREDTGKPGLHSQTWVNVDVEETQRTAMNARRLKMLEGREKRRSQRK